MSAWQVVEPVLVAPETTRSACRRGVYQDLFGADEQFPPKGSHACAPPEIHLRRPSPHPLIVVTNPLSCPETYLWIAANSTHTFGKLPTVNPSRTWAAESAPWTDPYPP